MTDYEALWRQEKARREELEEELRQLRAMPDDFVSPVDMRPSQIAYMRALLRAKVGAVVTHDQLMDISDSHAVRDPADRKVTHVTICRLRELLDPIGVVIETVPWQGYRLPQASRDAWQAAIDRMNAGVGKVSA